MTTLSEAQIADNILDFLIDEGWDVYSEVKLSEFYEGPCPTGILDIAALKGDLALAVEVKKSFSLSLLEQAIEWTEVFPMVVAAVPGSVISGKTGLREHLRSHFGLGVYTAFGSNVSVVSSPRLLRHNLGKVDRIRAALDGRMKISRSGSSATFRHSKYQDFAWYIRLELARRGPLAMKDLIRAVVDRGGIYHYSSLTGMKRQLFQAVSSFEPDFEIVDALVHWVDVKCPHGATYVERVRTAAGIGR